MKTLKVIGRYILGFVLTVSTLFTLWFAFSFIDIATKNHISDTNYKDYSDLNLIIIIENCLNERK